MLTNFCWYRHTHRITHPSQCLANKYHPVLILKIIEQRYASYPNHDFSLNFACVGFRIFFLSFIFQLGMFSHQRCSEEVLLERRENVSGREFCFSPWTYFSCPTTVMETETVTETESVRDCCQDIQAHCQDNNLLYLLVILPLITLVILTLVLVFCVCKMKAKLKILRESRTRKPSQNTETSETSVTNLTEITILSLSFCCSLTP